MSKLSQMFKLTKMKMKGKMENMFLVGTGTMKIHFTTGYPILLSVAVLVDNSEFCLLKYFKLYSPNEAFELICDQTHLYSLQLFYQPVKFSALLRFNSWIGTIVNELQAYLALQMAMGFCQKNEIEDYWSDLR